MNKQTLSLEIAPDLSQLTLMHDYLKKWQPDFVSISSLSRFSFDNIITCANYVQNTLNIPVVLHMTGLSHSQTDINKLLTVAAKKNISGLLLLQGNHYKNINIQNDFKHASDLIKYVKEKTNKFKILGACYPEVHPEAKSLGDDVKHLKLKAEAGCQRFISQMFFDNTHYDTFIDEVHKQSINQPILAGIMPLTNMVMVNWLKSNNIVMPNFVENTNDICQDGINFAVKQINELYTKKVSGIHLYTMNNWSTTNQIIKKIRKSEL
ncbi:methylenetetrahydrofolate reductase [Apilactobacillus apisilvae]|uniref:Methylenetetrahydrofolate reductase n=1 Tax=Apilactobacillus apisilvae TaxID=2923364 RepID=A0ABY4PG38_9LACO|nr:methylenetetrahydrofolate reductase [Apilactobacillus apisilvae]UQS84496.1 methylenetetrahydrofolate reductase [Apilactobacillus apisilvae]